MDLLTADNLHMEIDFDPSKSETNFRDRGFGFDFAARIFLGEVSTSLNRVQDGEQRMKAIGVIDGALYAVIYTDRGDVRRIISARPASRKERREWQASE